jgi:hypothetical protein
MSDISEVARLIEAEKKAKAEAEKKAKDAALKAKYEKSQSDWANDPRSVQSAYESYQRASQNAEEDPETFEQTRFRYMSLKNGPAWAAQERKNIADKKMAPILDAYRHQYNDLDNQAAVQSAYTDSIATIRNKQSSLKDSVSGNIDFLGNLLSEKLQKIGAFNRYIELADPKSAPVSPATDNPLILYFASFPPSFATILDVFIAILILIMLVVLVRKSGIKMTNLTTWFQNPQQGPGIPNISISSPGMGPVRAR